MQDITAPELAAWLADPSRVQPQLLDVREPWEIETCSIRGAVAMPMQSVPARLAELDDDKPVVCICHHGVRSAQVGHYLERCGFASVINLAGGIHAWAEEVDPDMPTY